jgi:flagellar basal-body rod protein FlgG
MPLNSLNALMQIARAGISAQQTNVDVISNNIANVNTIGYKTNRAEFQELLNTRMETPTPPDNVTPGQEEGTRLAATQRIFQQGRIEGSDRQWDLAIEGEGFFQVRLPDGGTAYTRDGAMHLDREGRLVTINGEILVPTITLPPDTEESYVKPNGEVMVRRRGEIDPQVIGTITLARFTNPSGLESIGDNLFQPTDSSGPARVEQPGANGMGHLLSFALEMSNVDLGQQATDLISAQRSYSLMTRALSTADEMLGLANQMRG